MLQGELHVPEHHEAVEETATPGIPRGANPRPAGQNGTAASTARWGGTIGNAVGQNQRWEGTDWNGTGAVQHEGLHQGSDWGDVLDMPQPTQTNISSTLEQ